MKTTIVQRTFCVYRVWLLRAFGYWLLFSESSRVFFLDSRLFVHFARLLKHPHWWIDRRGCIGHRISGASGQRAAGGGPRGWERGPLRRLWGSARSGKTWRRSDEGWGQIRDTQLERYRSRQPRKVTEHTQREVRHVGRNWNRGERQLHSGIARPVHAADKSRKFKRQMFKTTRI